MRVTRGPSLAIGLAAIALGGGLTALFVFAPTPSFTPIAVIAAWSYVGSGLVVWARRPTNRTGPLMVLIGLTFLGGLLSDSVDPTVRSIGLWVRPIHLAVFAHALLAFPSGRLGSRTARVIVVAIYVDLVVLYHAPLIIGDLAVATWLERGSYAIGAALFLAASIQLVRQWRAGSPAWRRAVSPVLWPGVLTLGFLAGTNATQFVGVPVGQPLQWAFRLTFAAMPYAFLVVLLRSHLARASVAELVVELDESRAPGALRDALARTLGDPTLELAYWLPEEGRYVDVDGQPVALPAVGSGRTATIVDRDGRRVAAVIHDDAIRDEPDLIRAATAAAALALDNERLQAELRARLDELTASRARIVHATDLERKRIERNLHDGTQQRLTSIAMALGLAESKLKVDPTAAAADLRQAKSALAVALSELRDLSQGIHPGILTTRGLGPAVEDLAYGAPLPVKVASNLDGRLPEPIEAGAYYVVAEALANVIKHAHASSATVSVNREDGRLILGVRDDGIGGADPARGSGLRGLSDRVQALGGTLIVESRGGRGTAVRAIIPCA